MDIYVVVSCRSLGADAYTKNECFCKSLDKRDKPLLHLKQLGHVDLSCCVRNMTIRLEKKLINKKLYLNEKQKQKKKIC